MIKHFMCDYAGLLAYSDWLRDQDREEEAIAFLNAIAEERGWSEGLVNRSGDEKGCGCYGGGGGYDGYSFGYSDGLNFQYDVDYGYVNGDGYGHGNIYGYSKYCDYGNGDVDGKGDGYELFDSIF